MDILLKPVCLVAGIRGFRGGVRGLPQRVGEPAEGAPEGGLLRQRLLPPTAPRLQLLHLQRPVHQACQHPQDG